MPNSANTAPEEEALDLVGPRDDQLFHATPEKTQHLAKGSDHPPLIEGSLRIYNMRLCPYAQRALLIAEAKKIKYDVVNVNLTLKPEWLLSLNPRGQVPTLEFEKNDWLAESLIVSDFLNEKFPGQRNLYPSDPLLKAKERLLIERFNGVITPFFKLMFSLPPPNRDTAEQVEAYEAIITELEQFEKELAIRRSMYFGGEKPGMLDYMMWPWFEREPLLRLLSPTDNVLRILQKYPRLTQWSECMKEDGAVKKWFLPAEYHKQYLLRRVAGNPEYELQNLVM